VRTLYRLFVLKQALGGVFCRFLALERRQVLLRQIMVGLLALWSCLLALRASWVQPRNKKPPLPRVLHLVSKRGVRHQQ